jgi:hypothetical protein
MLLVQPPSRISTDQLLLAFTGCHARPVYDMDTGFELSFWGEQNEPGWQHLRDEWKAHIANHKHYWVEITLMLEFGRWYREDYQS